MIDLALFLQLTASCAPHVAPETLAAVARTESGFNELAINDNTTRHSVAASSREDAVALATNLVSVQGHSVDLGLMQINSANLPGLGMSVAEAFDPCHSLTAAEHVLVAGYIPAAAPDAQQEALRQALSRYNTGVLDRGITNGYVARVQAAAEVVVPAIRLRSEPEQPPAPARMAVLPATPPASWDVYRQAQASVGGTLVFSGSRQQPVMRPALVQPEAAGGQQAFNDTR